MPQPASALSHDLHECVALIFLRDPCPENEIHALLKLDFSKL